MRVIRSVGVLGALLLTATTLSIAAAPPPASAATVVPIQQPNRIAAGRDHVCAIALDDSLSCWGTDQYGTLGRGTFENGAGNHPGRVLTTGSGIDAKRIREVAAGNDHTCALAIDGAVACWGANFGRLLGAGVDGEHVDEPLDLDRAGTVLAGRTVVRLVAGGSHTCALTSDGVLACWGANDEGQLGRGTVSDFGAIAPVVTPGTVLAGKQIAAIDARGNNTCALATDGTLACWGAYRGLGNGGGTRSALPVAPSRTGASELPAGPIKAFDVGWDHTCAVTVAGVAACWGSNSVGQLGDGSPNGEHRSPVALATAGTPLAGAQIVEVDAGGLHTCARTARAAVACWGENHSGQLGSGTTIDAPLAVGVVTSVTPLEDIEYEAVELGFRMSCATGVDGTIACWGTNAQGNLGNGTTPSSSLAVAPSGPTAPTDVRAHPGDQKVRVTWQPASTVAGSIDGYAVIPYVAGVRRAPVLAAAGATSAVVEGLPNEVRLRFRVVARGSGRTGPGPVSGEVVARPTNTYVPINPCRIVDTRLAGGALRDKQKRSYVVAGGGTAIAAQGGRSGGCGIPATASAVEATVTAVSPIASGYTRLWPADQVTPNATFLNFAARRSRTNTGPLSLARTGSTDLSLRHYGQPVHYVIDAQGYYLDRATTSTPTGMAYVPLEIPLPMCKVADTSQLPSGELVPGAARNYVVRGDGPAFEAQGGRPGGCGIPPEAVAVEVTLRTTSQGSGFMRIWAAGRSMPNATFLNYGTAETISNSGAVPLSTSGSADLALRAFGSPTDLRLHVHGYFVPVATAPLNATAYVAMQPCRVVDTRLAGGAFGGSTFERSYLVSGNQGFVAQGGNPAGCTVPDNATAASFSFSAVGPSGGGAMLAYPTGGITSDSSLLEYHEGFSTTNTASIGLAGENQTTDLTLKAFMGITHHVVDVQGYYLPLSQIPT